MDSDKIDVYNYLDMHAVINNKIIEVFVSDTKKSNKTDQSRVTLSPSKKRRKCNAKTTIWSRTET